MNRSKYILLLAIFIFGSILIVPLVFAQNFIIPAPPLSPPPKPVPVPLSLDFFPISFKRGSTGTQVTRLQELLKTMPNIYPEGLVTGYFGPLTENAVRRFQRKHGIEPIGIVGPKTRKKLNELVPLSIEITHHSLPLPQPIATTSPILPTPAISSFSPDRFNYYDYCWEYDCTATIPYPKLKNSMIPTTTAKVNANLRAVGTIKVLVSFLYNTDPIPDEALALLKGSSEYSLNYISQWYKENAKRYGVPFEISITFSEQYKVFDKYVMREKQDVVDIDFYEFVRQHIPDLSSYDAIVFFYYSSTRDAIPYGGYITKTKNFGGRNVISIFMRPSGYGYFDPRIEAGYTVSANIAHELTHFFGTADKYTCGDPNSASCAYALERLIGCVIETDNPAEKGRDLMCHRVPFLDPAEKWGFRLPPLNELLITEPTAKEMGWYDADGDGVLEVNDPCPFVRDNHCY